MRLYQIRQTPSELLRREVARRAAETRDEERRELCEALATATRPVPMYLLRHAVR